VEWVEADMNAQETLHHTMNKSRAVFMNSDANEHLVRYQCNVINIAAAQGVSHIVKLSSAMADPDSPLFIARAHGEVEEYLKGTGMTGTILRSTGFMQNWLGMLMHTVKSQRKIYESTGDGKRAYIDLRDIAEVAFKVLTEPDLHACHAYTLTGRQAVNYEQIAATITKIIGEQVTYIPITADAAKKQMEQKGVPQWTIATFMAYAKEQRNGKATLVSDDVPVILGKPARRIESFFTDYAELFK
jgi:uncharacterized protein YbjT (DUF2867 family)